MKKVLSGGFTIVELLVVLIVIGLLVVIGLNSFSGVQRDAKIGKAEADIGQLSSALTFAKISSGQTLIEITGTNCSECPCRSALSGSTLAKTHACWTDYEAMLDQIAAASGEALTDFYEGDAWGNPYLLDQNEGEFGPTDCRMDIITSAGPDKSYGAAADNITREIPLSISCS